MFDYVRIFYFGGVRGFGKGVKKIYYDGNHRIGFVVLITFNVGVDLKQLKE